MPIVSLLMQLRTPSMAIISPLMEHLHLINAVRNSIEADRFSVDAAQNSVDGDRFCIEAVRNAIGIVLPQTTSSAFLLAPSLERSQIG